MKTPALAQALGRSKGAVFNKAFSLGLRHGFIRAFTADEDRAIDLARTHGLSLTDLSAALQRDSAVISKHAIRLGVPFANRTVHAPRTRRSERTPRTLDSILALAAKAPPAADREDAPGRRIAPAETRARPVTTGRIFVALPGVPPMPQEMLAAMHAAGLLVAAATDSMVLLTPA